MLSQAPIIFWLVGWCFKFHACYVVFWICSLRVPCLFLLFIPFPSRYCFLLIKVGMRYLAFFQYDCWPFVHMFEKCLFDHFSIFNCIISCSVLGVNYMCWILTFMLFLMKVIMVKSPPILQAIPSFWLLFLDCTKASEIILLVGYSCPLCLKSLKWNRCSCKL